MWDFKTLTMEVMRIIQGFEWPVWEIPTCHKICNTWALLDDRWKRTKDQNWSYNPFSGTDYNYMTLEIIFFNCKASWCPSCPIVSLCRWINRDPESLSGSLKFTHKALAEVRETFSPTECWAWCIYLVSRKEGLAWLKPAIMGNYQLQDKRQI